MEINLKDLNHMDINDFLGKAFTCHCGKEHKVPVEKILIEEGAILKLPDILKGFNYKNILLVCDGNTYEAAGKLAESLLMESGFELRKLIYVRDKDLVPDEKAINELLEAVSSTTEVIAAVGSGVINDLSKYVSNKLHLPYVIIASAPSMDGFASDVAPLILNNLKVTCPAAPPKAIIGDVDILKKAPLEMILAGLGDVIGKYSALCDWKISHLLLDEYYCPIVTAMTENSVDKCIKYSSGYAKRDSTAIKNLMEALVLSGIAMSFTGNSRPASGAEHHLAHLQEMVFLFEGKEAVLHGTKVAVATIATLKMRELLASMDLDFKALRKRAGSFDEEEWSENIKRVYQKAAPGIFELSKKLKRNDINKRLERFDRIQENWPSILQIFRQLPAPEKIKELLEESGAAVSPKSIGISEALALDSLLYAKEVRDRYTLLQLLWDIDLLEEISEKTKDYQMSI